MHKFKPILLAILFQTSVQSHAEIEIVRYKAPQAIQPVRIAKPVISAQQPVAVVDSDPQINPPIIATSESSQNKALFSAPIQITRNQIPLRKPPSYVGCFYTSSKKYGIPVDILFAIAQTESSFNPGVRGKLGYGADHGLMQINDYWIPKLKARFNISLSDIYDPCTNIEVASWILAHNFNQYGYSWRAIGAYNAVTEWKRVRYIRRVYANLNKLHQGLI